MFAGETRGEGKTTEDRGITTSGAQSTLEICLLHHLDEEPLKGFKKVD